MASRRARNYFPTQVHPSLDTSFELHESDLWSNSDADTEFRSQISPSKPSRPLKSRPSGYKPTPTSSSLPVNIPDWSKILGSGGRAHWSEDHEADVDVSPLLDEDEDEDEDRVPPHEHAARQVARRNGMVVAFSVHEGVGRTLKGRDLRRVRNAIWKQTGFED